MASLALRQFAPSGGEQNPASFRKAERLQVLLPGKLTTLDGEFDCAIEDVSRSGARLIADVPLKQGQQGILKCHPLDMLFSVIWTDGKAAGIEFDDEVSLGVVRALRWHNDRYRSQHDLQLREMVQDWATGNSR